jgi:uracil-DNA glycosylase family 4
MGSGGFFDIKDLSMISKVGCPTCGLYHGNKHSKMEPTGEGKLGILIVAEAPGAEEDEKGIQLIGKTGQYLRHTLNDMGFDLDRDFRKTNACCCYPGKDTQPNHDQVAACRGRVFDEIKRFKPKVIILLGGPAIRSVIGNSWKHDGNYRVGERWRGLKIPDQIIKAWICPTWHPSYICRTEKESPVVDILWKKDLLAAIKLANVTLPHKPEHKIIKLKTADELWDQLLMLAKNVNLLGIDYETTGRKPYHPKQKIISCALAPNPNEAYVWRWDIMDTKCHAIFKRIMTNKRIGKIGANIRYEHNWTRSKLGYEIQGWWWDVNNAAHILDNRSGNTSVKFQVYSRLGVPDYDSNIRPYLSAEGSFGINRIEELDEDEELEYNANDSAYEFGIALAQRIEMKY